MTDEAKGEWGFRTDKGRRIEGVPSVVFPLVCGDSAGLGVVGTGFYIANDGIALTAKHCFLNSDGEMDTGRSFAAIHMIDKENWALRPLTWVSFLDDVDVAVCIAAPMQNAAGEHIPTQAFTLTLERPPIGTEIVSYSYPGSTVDKLGTKTQINLRPRFHDGKLIRYFPVRRDARTITWPCYETSMPLYGGASGGPVCRADTGCVFAINTSSIENNEDVSYVTPIDVILDVELNVRFGMDGQLCKRQIRDLIELGHVASDPASVER